LVASGAKCPATVFRRRPVTGEQYAPDIEPLAGVIEGGTECVNGLRTKGIADLRATECNPDSPLGYRAVIGDVGEVEAGNGAPSVGIESSETMKLQSTAASERDPVLGRRAGQCEVPHFVSIGFLASELRVDVIESTAGSVFRYPIAFAALLAAAGEHHRGPLVGVSKFVATYLDTNRLAAICVVLSAILTFTLRSIHLGANPDHLRSS